MSDRTFECYMCGNTFRSAWTEKDADAEYEKTFGKHMGEKRAVLCEECNDAFLKWYARLNKSKVHQ